MKALFYWEGRKRWQHLQPILILYIMLFPVSWLLRSGVVRPELADSLLTAFSVLNSIGCIFLTIVYPTLSLLLDLKQEYSILERMSDSRFSRRLMARIALNAFCILVGAALFKALSSFMAASAGASSLLLLMNNVDGYPIALFMVALSLPLMIQWAYLAFISRCHNIIHRILMAIAAVSFCILFVSWSSLLPDGIELLFSILLSIVAYRASVREYERVYEFNREGS